MSRESFRRGHRRHEGSLEAVCRGGGGGARGAGEKGKDVRDEGQGGDGRKGVDGPSLGAVLRVSDPGHQKQCSVD